MHSISLDQDRDNTVHSISLKQDRDNTVYSISLEKNRDNCKADLFKIVAKRSALGLAISS